MWWGHSGFGGLPTTTGIKTTACHVTRSHDPCGNPEEDSQSEGEFPSLSVAFSEKMSQTYRCSTHTFSYCHESWLSNTHPAEMLHRAERTSENQSETLCLAQFRASPPLFTHRAQHLLEIEPSCKSSSSKRGDKNAKSETITGCEDVGWERRELYNLRRKNSSRYGLYLGMNFRGHGCHFEQMSCQLLALTGLSIASMSHCIFAFYTQAIKSATKHCDPPSNLLLIVVCFGCFPLPQLPSLLLAGLFFGWGGRAWGWNREKRQIQGGGRGLHLQLYD